MSSARPVRVLTRRTRLARTITVATLVVVFAIATTVILGQGNGSGSPISATQVNAPATRAGTAAGTRGTALDPAVFSAGSCVAFAPTSGNRHLTVFLDAGHGGPDPGGQGVTQSGQVVSERDLTLPVVLEATKMLRVQGFRVVDSRTTSAAVIRLQPADLSGSLFSLEGAHRDVAARPLCADLANASALVSVHFNVGVIAQNAGTETTYDAVRPFATASQSLATLLQTATVAALHAVSGWNVPDNGVVTDDQVGNSLTSRGAAYGHLLVLGPAEANYFSTPSTMPGALIEPLFLTDPFEGTIASSSNGQRIIAQAIAKAVQQFLTR